MDKEKIKGVHFVTTLLNYLNKSETKNQCAVIIGSGKVELNRYTHELNEKDLIND
jgi:hypothetical protein